MYGRDRFVDLGENRWKVEGHGEYRLRTDKGQPQPSSAFCRRRSRTFWRNPGKISLHPGTLSTVEVLDVPSSKLVRTEPRPLVGRNVAKGSSLPPPYIFSQCPTALPNAHLQFFPRFVPPRADVVYWRGDMGRRRGVLSILFASRAVQSANSPLLKVAPLEHH